MADDELTFQGSDAVECTGFIRKIHKLAYDERRHRDSEWMADRAMICFDGNALVWYHQQPLETRSDWEPLRGALLTRYVTLDPAARPMPAQVDPSSRVDVPTITAAEHPSTVLDTSDSTKVYRIKVIVPSHVGYVSKTYGAGTRGRCCILTADRDEAIKVRETVVNVSNPPRLALQIEGSQRNDSRGREFYEHLCLASFDGNNEYLPATWGGWLIAARQLSADTYSINDDSQTSPEVVPTPWMTGKDGTLSAARPGMVGWSANCRDLDRRDAPETWKTFSDKFIPVICNTPSGDKTLHFWSRRVWEDKDDQFVANMYLERVV